MKELRFLLPVLFLFSLQTISAQDTLRLDSTFVEKPRIKVLEDTLGLLAFTMVKSESDTLRFAACRKFIPMLVDALQEPESFYYTFERLRTVSTLYAPDSSFRIFTWQLEVSPDERRYFGAVQMNSEDLQLYPLIDRSFVIDDHQAITDNEKWIGALYYKVMKFDSPQGEAYLLFGYDHPNVGLKRKLIEVLHFTDDGPRFGAPVFHIPRKDSVISTFNRIVLEYDALASVSLNYDPELDMIIHDHIIVTDTKQGPKFVPDGSFDGFYLEDGTWHRKSKIFNQMVDEAPRPRPVLDSPKKKDLFGK